ncbi:MAG: ABC transporter substrate-binding protein [Eubacterium sp.]|nr:ABC transporter substrate-binding protein [Eubacterium sp.]
MKNHTSAGRLAKPGKRKQILFFFLALLCLPVLVFSGCGKEETEDENVVYVYNFGDYADPDVYDMFTEETGIEVVVDEYDTNEDMYPKVASGAAEYDVICPSDYMISKMINNDLLQPLQQDLLPTAAEYIDKEYLQFSESYDPGNIYSIPYSWGTIGIMYNTTILEEEPDTWDILWDPVWKDEILMQESVRDTFGITLKRLGYSMNTTDKDELEDALNELIDQKELVQAYVIDEARDKLVSGEAALGVVYSGEALWMIDANEDLAFSIPEEGTNIWLDSWVIPANARHVENAHAFIDFMCRPDIAALNCEYLTYSTPNNGARDYIEDEYVLESEEIFPDMDEMPELEAFNWLGEEMDQYYSDLWLRLKSS